MKLFLTILLLFIIADVMIVAYVIWRRSRRRISEKTREEIRTSWKKIIRLQDRRHAVLEADKLLDHALDALGHRGNLGNKLKKGGALFSDLDAVWRAHKIRNNIAHQMNYEVKEAAYKNTMLAFKRAFKDLHIF